MIEVRRKKGITIMIDRGLGLRATEDLIETVGDYVDVFKFSGSLGHLYPKHILEQKMQMLHDAEIAVQSGGTTIERYIRDNGYAGSGSAFVEEVARPLGYDIIEVPLTFITPTEKELFNLIAEIRKAGLSVHFEIGFKDPKRDGALTAKERVMLINKGLEAGATRFAIEGRVKGATIDASFNEFLERIEREGISIDPIIFEAPLTANQCALIERFGPEVNIGNVPPEGVMVVEALRQGVKFETAHLFKDGGKLEHGRQYWIGPRK
jgi:phosphosulfolactate synthase